jgi:hypothetical protein
MNLEHLRDECPLTEFDYAAVRARVRSEIALRQQRKLWVFRFASAFVAATLAVLAFIPIEPVRVPLSVSRADIASREIPAAEAAAAPQVFAAKVQHRRHHPHSHPLTTNPQLAVSRIEIHTADPDVRIIWIVPKENS